MTAEADEREFGTLKEEARRNTKRIDPMGVRLHAQTMRLYVQPGLDALAVLGEADERCGTCAFRDGTVPGGCIQTQADALKAIMEDVPFYCHAHMADGEPDRICHGWFAARSIMPAGHKTNAPWPWCADITEDDPLNGRLQDEPR